MPDQLGKGAKAVCGNCKTELTSGHDGDGHPTTLDDAGFTGQIASGKWLVDFWAPWCGPCRMIAPVLDEIASQRSDVRVGKLNVDENQRTAAQYGVMSIPTMILFKHGQPAKTIVGAYPKRKLEAELQPAL